MDTKTLFQEAKNSNRAFSELALWREFRDSQPSQLKFYALRKTVLLMFRSSGIYTIWLVLALVSSIFYYYFDHAAFPFILYSIPLSFAISVVAVVLSPTFHEAYDMAIVIEAYEKERRDSGAAVAIDS
jgi:hypothetical protein